MANLEIALGYLRRGWSVIPLKPVDGNPEDRKRSRGSWSEFQQKRPVEQTVVKWFDKPKEYGIAVVLGDVSGGLICRDFDTMAAYRNWAGIHPDLARELPTVATGDNGRHVYCRSQTPISELRRLGTLPDNAYFDLGDGECRIDRCYCVLPPTLHPSGIRYGWLNPPADHIPQIDFVTAGFRKAWDVTERDRDAQSLQRTTESHIGGIGENLPLTKLERSDLETNDCLARSLITAGLDLDGLADSSRSRVETIILDTLPRQEGERNRKIFELARSLKGIPEFADAQPGNVRDIVRHWHSLALPVIGTKPFELTWTEFIRGWKRVKFPKGQEPVMEIFNRALKQTFPPEASMYDAISTRKLLLVCRELSRSMCGGVFFLSVRTAGNLIECSPMHASRLFEMMEADGLLAVVERGSNKTQKATRFRYLGSQ